MENIKKAIDEIAKSQKKVSAILKDEPNLALKCTTVFDSIINQLAGIAGTPIGQTEDKFIPSPITHMMGFEILAPVELKVDKPTNADREALIKEVNEAYSTFLERKSEDLLKNLEDITLRGIAKKAGMQVTMTEPQKITVKFIDAIKQAITDRKAVDKIAIHKKFADSQSAIAATYGKTMTEELLAEVAIQVDRLIEADVNLDEALFDLGVEAHAYFSNLTKDEVQL